MDIGVIIVLVLSMGGLLFLAIMGSRFLARQAVCQVVSTFREKNATRPEMAITFREIGISVWAPFIGVNGIVRDYRPWALDKLVQAGVVRTAERGMFYLSEDTLNSTHADAGCPWNKKETDLLRDAARIAELDKRK